MYEEEDGVNGIILVSCGVTFWSCGVVFDGLLRSLASLGIVPLLMHLFSGGIVLKRITTEKKVRGKERLE